MYRYSAQLNLVTHSDGRTDSDVMALKARITHGILSELVDTRLWLVTTERRRRMQRFYSMAPNGETPAPKTEFCITYGPINAMQSSQQTTYPVG